jgi:phosphohistidine phosphatase
MKLHRVYLVRHAKAEPKGADDALRRLTPEGRSAFVAFLEGNPEDLALSRIVTSPYARARETAALLAGFTGAPVEADDALASGSSSGRDLIALARRAPAGTALVGHNPEFAEAVALAAGREVAVKPGAVAALDVEEGEVSLAWLRAP